MKVLQPGETQARRINPKPWPVKNSNPKAWALGGGTFSGSFGLVPLSPSEFNFGAEWTLQDGSMRNYVWGDRTAFTATARFKGVQDQFGDPSWQDIMKANNFQFGGKLFNFTIRGTSAA